MDFPHLRGQGQFHLSKKRNAKQMETKLIVMNKYDKKRKCGSDESAGRCEK
jgi:hypothetical protein